MPDRTNWPEPDRVAGSDKAPKNGQHSKLWAAN